jgi:predicted transcriptional regulator of viral defense system
MKRSFILFLLFCIPLLQAETGTKFYVLKSEPVNLYLTVWEAVKQVEAGGDNFAVNEKEQAYGAGQIRQCKLIDYNRANNAVLTLQDCFNEAVSRKVWLWHCSRYNDIETAIKRWNGQGKMADDYLNRVLCLIN